MSSHLERLHSAEANDVLSNPEYYGLPTFDQFKNNYEKYMGRDDDILAQASNGSKLLKNVEKKYRFELLNYRCDTLEEVERIAKEQGIPLKELDFRPVLLPLGGGKADILVKFVTKSDVEKRNAILG